MSDQATAAQFRYSGPITVTHLNTRKEGDEDDKVLSVDVKFEARMSSGEVFGGFAPELHHDLFTDIGAVRNAMLGPITFALLNCWPVTTECTRSRLSAGCAGLTLLRSRLAC